MTETAAEVLIATAGACVQGELVDGALVVTLFNLAKAAWLGSVPG